MTVRSIGPSVLLLVFSMSPLPQIRATTILAVRRNGAVALGGDGQVTVGETVMKAKANKVRAIGDGKLLAGFAGSAADALTHSLLPPANFPP